MNSRLYIALPVLSLAVMGQDAKDPREILIRSGGPLIGARSLRLTGTRTIYRPTGAIEKTSFVFELSDGKTRREEKHDASSQVVETLRVFDGTTDWTFTPSRNSYLKWPGSVAPSEEIRTWTIGRDPKKFSSAVLESQEALEVNGQPASCAIIHANYSTKQLNPVWPEITRTVWVCGEHNLILRDIWETASTSGTSRTETRYTGIEWDISIDPSRFVFEPPPGSNQDQIIGGIIGAVPSKAPSAPGAPPPSRVPPAITKRIDPAYTDEARQAKLQGIADLYVEITPEGRPQNAQIIEGLGLGLDDQAVTAVQQWQFRAGARTGVVARSIAVRFRLPQQQGPSWYVLRTHYSAIRERGKQATTMSNPILISYTSPDANACEAGGDGVVEVQADVSDKGVPLRPSARESTNTTLEQAALAAVASWRFRPGTIEGKGRTFHFAVALECVRASDRPGDTSRAVSAPPGPASNPTILYRIEPEYLEAARKAKLQGEIWIDGTVTATGHFANLVIYKLLGMSLDFKAMEAVRQWRFEPATKDGKRVSIAAHVEVHFRLL
jgi:TonB family protein